MGSYELLGSYSITAGHPRVHPGLLNGWYSLLQRQAAAVGLTSYASRYLQAVSASYWNSQGGAAVSARPKGHPHVIPLCTYIVKWDPLVLLVLSGFCTAIVYNFK